MSTAPYTGSPLQYDVVAAQYQGSITVTRFLQALPKFFCCGEWVGMPNMGGEHLDIKVGEEFALGHLLVAIRLDKGGGGLFPQTIERKTLIVPEPHL